MLVDDADAAGIEGHRHKHRHKNQRCGDQGSDQFAHALHRRLAGLHALLQVLGHGLNHHNGVIHHQARGQHQAQQGELVNREAKGLDEGKGAQQRNRDRQAGHDRGAPVLEEQKQNQQHQHNRQAEGIHHPFNGRFNELTDVVDLGNGDSGGQLGTKGIDHLDHGLRDIKSVALWSLENSNGEGWITFNADGLLAEGVEAIGGFAHILEPQQVALGGLADDQAIEILN